MGRLGDPLSSPVSGTVVTPIIQDVDYGMSVAIRADSGPYKGYTFHTAHMSGKVVEIGQKVKPGEYFGMVGSTGRSTGAHIHLEVYTPGGVRIDPRTVEWAGNRVLGDIPSLSAHTLATTPLVPKGSVEQEIAAQTGAAPAPRDPRPHVTLGPLTIAKKAEGEPGDERPGEKPFGAIELFNIPGIGPVTMVGPGERFIRLVTFGIATVVFLIAFAAIIGKAKVGGSQTTVKDVAKDLAVDVGKTAATAAVA